MQALKLNLLCGLRLAFLQNVAPSRLRVSSDQFWLLVAVTAAICFATDWAITKEPKEFNPFGIWELALLILCMGFGTHLAARLGRAPNLQIQLPFCMLAAAPYLIFTGGLLLRLSVEIETALPGDLAVYGIISLWAWLVVTNAIRMCARSGAAIRLIQATVVIALLAGPALYYPQPGFWYTGWETTEEALPAAEPLDVEQIFFDQPGLMANQLRGLMPQRSDHTDLYVLGVAGFGAQDVFRKEVEYLQQLSETTLPVGLRFLPLINHRDTLTRVPLASLTNLEAATESLGRMMDTEEDVLMVYITSHGTENHEVALELGRLPFNTLNPQTLSSALDRARARWKILVISACFSGGFVNTLAGPDTLVITASRADRHSFGCEIDADLTWFGRAFLEEGLALGLGFQAAFTHAEARIYKWEIEQELEHSEPQMHMGSAIREKLREMDLL